ncbi:MAG: PqqD family protein [Leptolyngbya sp. SIO4C1]|nr:PqqD family protein [Leptolyngbya sp. SIO4C1]
MARYQLNSQHVAQECIDDEVVIIHLDNGNYFNLEGSGAEIWTAIIAGAAVEDVVTALSEVYEASPAQTTESVHNLISHLVAEDLIIELTETVEQRPPSISQLVQTMRNGNVDSKAAFTPPALQKYQDMQDLLLLDPLHDVDESAGWPVTKA